MRTTGLHWRSLIIPLAKCILVAGLFARSTHVQAQQPVTRADAERAALSAGPRIALARADSAAARARLMSATALPNPTLSASYSKSAPREHLALELPLDVPWVRGPRIAVARAGTRVAVLRSTSERTAALLEVDTTYTAALAAGARFRLSRQTARDAETLRGMASTRRDAGDASDLDVDLAAVAAGQQLNLATADSLAYMSAVLTVQTLMGIPADSQSIVLADSLVLGAGDLAVVGGTDSLATPASFRAPFVLAAEAAVEASTLAVTREQRSVFGEPSLLLGVDWGSPTGDEPGILPVIGISLPIPLFNRNHGPIAEARAEQQRARAELSAARLETTRVIVEGRREREALLAKVARDRDLVVRADRVAAKSLVAYREGASALPAVLEARRIAREVLGQYVDDLAALLTVTSELRALTTTVPVP